MRIPERINQPIWIDSMINFGQEELFQVFSTIEFVGIVPYKFILSEMRNRFLFDNLRSLAGEAIQYCVTIISLQNAVQHNHRYK